jgi:alpha-tubulin suppressor-like RCC1 family protein
VITATPVNGIATFSNLYIYKAAIGYTLSASAPNLTSATSAPFEIKPGAAAILKFLVQPKNATASSAIPFSIGVQDSSGNTVSGASNSISVYVSINPSNGTPPGPVNVTAVNGVASSSDLRISRAGFGYKLTAVTSGLPAVSSESFNIAAGPAAKLAFTSQPASANAGDPIAPPVVVEVQDAAGNRASTNTLVTVALATNTEGARLSGTTTVMALDGSATFGDLRIDKLGVGLTLVASASDFGPATSAPFSVRDLFRFTAITAGYFHSCGIANTGGAFCWGANYSGQLGNTASNSTVRSPIPVIGGSILTTISGGRDHACGLTAAGVAYCWGANENGQLGNGGAGSTPSPVSGDLTFAQISAGYDHTCGVTTTGAGYCWGSGTAGDLGNGSISTKNVPTLVSGGLTFRSIVAGRNFTCGVTTTDAAYCWGDNYGGMLGDGTVTQRLVPSAVTGQLKFASVAAGGFHSCGLTTEGKAYCWGTNGFGQLGHASSTQQSTVPIEVAGEHVFTSLTVGNRHNCGIIASGAAYCWGDDSGGNLGDGTFLANSTPVPVAGGLTLASISAGRFHTCAVTTNNEGYCWGQSTLGDGTSATSNVPVRVR